LGEINLTKYIAVFAFGKYVLHYKTFLRRKMTKVDVMIKQVEAGSEHISHCYKITVQPSSTPDY